MRRAEGVLCTVPVIVNVARESTIRVVDNKMLLLDHWVLFVMVVGVMETGCNELDSTVDKSMVKFFVYIILP
jgi:hypothetical protein